ncbi:hypothetical protein [Seonamhaeicola algicola]|nr:hypothetical protein [Seonamhaeicola algicola]
MSTSKIIYLFVLLVYILFSVFGFIGYEDVSVFLNALIVPLIAVNYFLFFKGKTKYFILFMICYTISDLEGLLVDLLPETSTFDFIVNTDYYIGNSLYILSYVFLILLIAQGVNFIQVLKNFKIHLIVLLSLNIWLVYVLQVIVTPTTMYGGEFFLELIYNVVMLLLLSVALLNYFYKDNKKALYLFLGTMCIVFSEVVDVAYIYMAHRHLLVLLSTTLTLLAFFFFCRQAELLDVKKDGMYV